jgi:hypothetical protein
VSRSGSRLRRLAIGVSAALVLAACGLPSDDQPAELAADQIPPELLAPAPESATTSTLPVLTLPFNLYFFDPDDLLRAEPRQIRTPATEADVLLQLFTGTTEQGKSTAIPPGLELIDARTDAATRTLTIALNDALFDIQSTELSRAIAQMVFTGTALAGVDQVRFEIEGQLQAVPDGRGDSQSRPVTRDDYVEFDPVAQATTTTAPPPPTTLTIP